MEKTNAIRLLDAKKIPYQIHCYDASLTDGMSVAKAILKEPACVFKTLVCVDSFKQYVVFMVPVCSELDLKKTANSLKAKYVEMIPQKNLLSLTGYVHGGCSPLGMKKTFRTIVDESALLFSTICFSGGKKGLQIEMAPLQLKDLINASFFDISK